MERLPSAIAACAERWELTVGEPLSGGLVGHVYACTTRDGAAAVLKLSPPSSDRFAGTPAQEAGALRAWGGRGGVELLAFASDQRALLTRRAQPGTPLPIGDNAETLGAVAGVLTQLFEATPPPTGFKALQDVVDQHLVRKLAIAGDAHEQFTPRIGQARAAARRLAFTAPRVVLGHGDLMAKNLLRDQDRLLAIDPMPYVGDPHADIGFWAANHPPVAGLVARAAALARLLACDPDRASVWAAVYAIGAACEAWRNDTSELREWACSSHATWLLQR
jgi:streptomycin 6-kinase